MLMTRPSHGYAIACSSFLRQSIALLNASIIPSYIIMVSECTSEDCTIFDREEDASELSSPVV